MACRIFRNAASSSARVAEFPVRFTASKWCLSNPPSRRSSRMVWSSVLAMMGLPPKNSRRMYSETEIPAVAACRVNLSSSSAVSLSVRRLCNLLVAFRFSICLSCLFESVRSVAPNALRESRGGAFGRMLAVVRQLPSCKEEPPTVFGTALHCFRGRHYPR